MGVSDHAARDSGGFGAHPRTPTRPWRVVFDGLVKAFKQWRRWQIGTIHEVGWIADGTTPGISITAAIPPIFEAYATCYEPDGVTIIAHERALVERLAEVTSDQLWWLGYLDTGAHSVVFEHVPKVLLYWNWPYVLVAAGPTQALSWRTGHMRGAGVLPDLFFPEDRSWLVSALWDDTWTCIGGPDALIEVLRKDPLIKAHCVELDGDAKPPGRERE